MIFTYKEDISETINSVMRNMISQLGNLFYQTLFVLDIKDGSLQFISISNSLARLHSIETESIKNINDIARPVSVSNEWILREISERYNRSKREDREHLLFVVDLEMTFFKFDNYGIWKFTPLTENPDGTLRHLVGVLALSSGSKYDTFLYAINTNSEEGHYYDFAGRFWRKLESPLLSRSEFAVLAYSCRGLTVSEIAELIFRSPDTVKAIRKNIFKKLNVSNITEAIIYATNHKMI